MLLEWRETCGAFPVSRTVKTVATIAYTSRAVTLSDATCFPNADRVPLSWAFLWST